MKEEFKDEEKLSAFLDGYHVEVPERESFKRQTRFERFIRFIGSPAEDPFETWTATERGFLLTKALPLAAGLFFAVMQFAILL